MKSSNDDSKNTEIELSETKESRGWRYQELKWKECEVKDE